MKKNSILNNDKVVREVVENSGSIKECLEKLNLRAAGGNYKAFHAACKRIGINPPQVDYSRRTRNAISRNTIPLKDILVENSGYMSRAQIKKRCIEAGLLENKCYNPECGIGPEWAGKPLTLQLEHKNGIYNDHRIENLELLCPNCHSQTDTFAGRNSKNNEPNKICLECSRSFRNRANIKYCSKECYDKNRPSFPKPSQRKVPRPPKQEVLDNVAKLGYSATGRLYGVSDNAVRKWIKTDIW